MTGNVTRPGGNVCACWWVGPVFHPLSSVADGFDLKGTIISTRTLVEIKTNNGAIFFFRPCWIKNWWSAFSLTRSNQLLSSKRYISYRRWMTRIVLFIVKANRQMAKYFFFLPTHANNNTFPHQIQVVHLFWLGFLLFDFFSAFDLSNPATQDNTATRLSRKEKLVTQHIRDDEYAFRSRSSTITTSN